MKGTCTIKSENQDYLIWKWNNLPFVGIRYIIFWFVLILGVCGIMMYGSSLVFYPREVAGALWCYYTAFIPVFYFIFRKLIPFSINLVK